MSYKIISKFIKDISFEIPDARTFVMLEKEISKYNLNFDIKSKPFKENIIEVNTILSLVPNQDVKHKILTEINLATLISIEKKLKDKKELEKIILITDRKSVVQGKSVDLGGRRIIKKKKIEKNNTYHYQIQTKQQPADL